MLDLPPCPHRPNDVPRLESVDACRPDSDADYGRLAVAGIGNSVVGAPTTLHHFGGFGAAAGAGTGATLGVGAGLGARAGAGGGVGAIAGVASTLGRGGRGAIAGCGGRAGLTERDGRTARAGRSRYTPSASIFSKAAST